MPAEEFRLEVQDLIQRIRGTETKDFFELAKIAGLNTAKDFAGADLSGVNLSGVNLSNVNLSGAILSRSILSYTNLCSSSLSYANLGYSNLSYVKLDAANLSFAILDHAILSGTILSSAEVEHARFGDNSGLSEDTRLELKQRGAIFEGSSGNCAEVLMPH